MASAPFLKADILRSRRQIMTGSEWQARRRDAAGPGSGVGEQSPSECNQTDNQKEAVGERRERSRRGGEGTTATEGAKMARRRNALRLR